MKRVAQRRESGGEQQVGTHALRKVLILVNISGWHPEICEHTDEESTQREYLPTSSYAVWMSWPPASAPPSNFSLASNFSLTCRCTHDTPCCDDCLSAAFWASISSCDKTSGDSLMPPEYTTRISTHARFSSLLLSVLRPLLRSASSCAQTLPHPPLQVIVCAGKQEAPRRTRRHTKCAGQGRRLQRWLRGIALYE